MGLAATRAYNLGIVIGHFVQKGGKRLTTVRAQKISCLIAHICSRHSAASHLLLFGSRLLPPYSKVPFFRNATQWRFPCAPEA
jgi:hypothetical protein